VYLAVRRPSRSAAVGSSSTIFRRATQSRRYRVRRRLPSENRVPLRRWMIASFSNRDQVYLFAGRPGTSHDALDPDVRSVLGFGKTISTARTSTIWRSCIESGRAIRYTTAKRSAGASSTEGQPHLLAPRYARVLHQRGRGFTRRYRASIRTPVSIWITAHPAPRRQEGQEVGVRASPRSQPRLTFVYYTLQQSETIMIRTWVRQRRPPSAVTL